MNCCDDSMLYQEYLPKEFSIAHKITERTEKRTFHLHSQMEIVFALSSNLKCKFEDMTVEIPQNGMIVLTPLQLHYIYSEAGSGLCDRYVIYFSTGYISALSNSDKNLMECFLRSERSGRSDKSDMIVKPDEKYVPKYLRLLERLDKNCNQPQIFADDEQANELLNRLILGEFLLMVNHSYQAQYGQTPSTTDQNNFKLAYEICEYVKSHITENLTVQSVSHEFGISKTQLYYIFTKIIGTTLSKYISDYRITMAKNLLLTTDKSIDHISYETGYSSLSAFSRVFKKETGYSPLQYKKEMRQDGKD